jgi:hypothetical protein
MVVDLLCCSEYKLYSEWFTDGIAFYYTIQIKQKLIRKDVNNEEKLAH